MQNKSSNFISILFALLSCSTLVAQNNTQLSVADSLFEQKKYTESFEIYSSLLDQEEQASPRMLLKMAYIKEGLGDYSNALYYLNLYYLQTSDKHARNKMKEIADEESLTGFSVDDTDYMIGLLIKYQTHIQLSLFAVLVLMLSYLGYKKIKLKSRPVGSLILFSTILIALLYFINFGVQNDQAIIVENHAYVMSGPSSGSDLLDVVAKGHRIKTYSEHGPWLEIKWNDQRAFIKKNKVRKIG